MTRAVHGDSLVQSVSVEVIRGVAQTSAGVCAVEVVGLTATVDLPGERRTVTIPRSLSGPNTSPFLLIESAVLLAVAQRDRASAVDAGPPSYTVERYGGMHSWTREELRGPRWLPRRARRWWS